MSFDVVPALFGRHVRPWLPIAREAISESCEPAD